MIKLASWGRLSNERHEVVALTDRSQVAAIIRSGPRGLAYGMGRSYGDACLNPGGVVWRTTGLDRFVSFDERTGRLECEAGVLLRDIQSMAVPRGWMLPVSPGTQWVTVGGAIANDVHGKNHHLVGSFGDCVKAIVLMRTDGEIVECGPQLRSDWFAATIGGIGLTGVIAAAELQLKPVAGPWLESETVPYRGLDAFFELTNDSESDWEYVVSWTDCASASIERGLFMRGNHSRARKDAAARRAMAVPVVPPISMVNRLTTRFFNIVYYHAMRRQRRTSVHFEPFLYPLDAVLEWNRMYGPKGFYQYQCVVPTAQGKDVVATLVREVARSGEAAFLPVLKRFGNRESQGLLSFPMPGITLAVDFPNRGPRTERLFERMDAIVQEAGGRLYLAKDARMPRTLFEKGYPKLAEFLRYRDPGISSAMSKRLMGY